jgi:hypothetical protein
MLPELLSRAMESARRLGTLNTASNSQEAEPSVIPPTEGCSPKLLLVLGRRPNIPTSRGATRPSGHAHDRDGKPGPNQGHGSSVRPGLDPEPVWLDDLADPVPIALGLLRPSLLARDDRFHRELVVARHPGCRRGVWSRISDQGGRAGAAARSRGGLSQLRSHPQAARPLHR